VLVAAGNGIARAAALQETDYRKLRERGHAGEELAYTPLILRVRWLSFAKVDTDSASEEVFKSTRCADPGHPRLSRGVGAFRRVLGVARAIGAIRAETPPLG